MAIYKCKLCGYTLDTSADPALSGGGGFEDEAYACPYCGAGKENMEKEASE